MKGEVKPVISRITIFPVKSLDGISVEIAEVVDGGCLKHDREFAIIDAEGHFINGKANPLVHSLRSEVDFDREQISFRHEKEAGWNIFHLEKEKAAIQIYLTKFFGIPATLHRNKTGRFLDIPDLSGITVLATSSLEAVSEWFDHMDMEEVRRRFRATIELTGVPAFWEDHLFAGQGSAIEFMLGDVKAFGVSPRERCVVPSRHPVTGEVHRGFQKSFAMHRDADLPAWSHLKEYGHAYYLSVDCAIPPSEYGKQIHVGDALKIIGKITG